MATEHVAPKATVAVLGTLLLVTPCSPDPGRAQEQEAEELALEAAGSPMEVRVRQVLNTFRRSENCAELEAALDDAPAALWGGLRPVVSKDYLEVTHAVEEALTAQEQRFARHLGALAKSGRCPELAGRALDLKLFIEEISEVAQAVGQVTAKCGVEDRLDQPPCDELLPLLDEQTGHELTREDAAKQISVLRPSYSVKLRSPFVAPWLRRPQEDVRVTDPIGPGECVVVFKEFKGLMLRLHLERIVIVTDPWVSLFGQPRGTPVPIWRLEWVFSEYVKEWNICNVGDGQIRKTVTQVVKQDFPLNFFWRYYPKDP